MANKPESDIEKVESGVASKLGPIPAEHFEGDADSIIRGEPAPAMKKLYERMKGKIEERKPK